ncbi:organoarsenical effux MFS transporter ArsJ [Thalassotalea sp. PLHSN55]|uniref:organoarsenical effux MFS transporter ArsJ n=1 Tax=Thalassotalea sp. PLHSN55 TaxID=3435888 RepID=UPI003F85E7E5
MFSQLRALPLAVKQYLIITMNYWFFTLSDGALRMLVVLYFHQLGYQPLAIASLFLFYEAFGVVTNLVGGWLGARLGLNKTMNVGLFLQVAALLMLTVDNQYLTVIWVMAAQALSGIAKDLNKMSAKSSIKTLVPSDQQGALFKWVALLTGSKNTLKGVGFFLGGLLLHLFGFQQAMLVMAIVLMIIAVLSVFLLNADMGKAKSKAKFSEIFSKSADLNYLSAARLCLFAARDVWFVVALPVYLSVELNWSHSYVGAFMASWVIAYGVVQAFAPKITRANITSMSQGRLLFLWALALSVVTALIAFVLSQGLSPALVITIGLLLFGITFAINSSLHSFVIVAMAKEDGVSMDVGFYYMANALGRLVGTILSGWVYQQYNITACLIVAAFLALSSAFFIRKINY